MSEEKLNQHDCDLIARLKTDLALRKGIKAIILQNKFRHMLTTDDTDKVLALFAPIIAERGKLKEQLDTAKEIIIWNKEWCTWKKPCPEDCLVCIEVKAKEIKP